MEFEPIVEFKYDDSETPVFYWAKVTIPANQNYEIVSFEDKVPDSEANTYRVDVNIQPLDSGSKTINAMVGDLEASSVEKFVRFNLVDNSETASGDKTVSTESAESESRPGD